MQCCLRMNIIIASMICALLRVNFLHVPVHSPLPLRHLCIGRIGSTGIALERDMERLVYMSLAGRSSKWHLCGKCHVRGIFQLLNLFC